MRTWVTGLRRRAARRSRRGQVVFYIVLILLILLVMSIFIFDLQSFIRLRDRSQNAVDAAVLAAAGWQGRSLNIIGELNLVKASTQMLADVGAGDDAAARRSKLLAEDAAITQMQTRITYAGPLLGYLAAQQAAKNNGLRAVPAFTDSLRRHLNDCFTPTGDGLYAQIYAANIPYQGYDWLTGYESMLRLLIVEEISAKAVNSRYLQGMPVLTGPGAELLMDPSFYVAVHSYDFCWFINRGIMEADYYDFSGIELVRVPNGFFPGSEFMNLFVGFQQQAVPWSALGPLLSARGLTPLAPDEPGLDQLQWAVYDNGTAGWSDTGNYDYLDQYLRSPVRDEFRYGGAAARMFCQSRPALLSGRWTWKHGEQDLPGTKLGDELKWSTTNFDGPNTSFSAHGERLTAAENSLAELRSRAAVYSSAAAKPFGSLDTEPPHAAGIVLPVYNQVRLIPAALVKENVYDRDFTFYEFILAYFGDPNYPNVPDTVRQQYLYYISAIEAFVDHDSNFHVRWRAYELWREAWMNGPDGQPATADDRQDPCRPTTGGGGGGGGGGSGGGPGILH